MTPPRLHGFGKPSAWSATLVAAVALFLSGPPVLAHEIGTTRVALIQLDEHRYDLEVVTDAVALLEKLESVSGEASISTLDPAVLRQRLEGLGAVFQNRVIVAFDGRPVTPVVSWSVTPATAIGGSPRATIRLAGPVPSSVKTLRWMYGWTFSSYAFVARRGTAGTVTEWLEGGETSGPLSISEAAPAVSRLRLAGRYVVLGFTHILPKGLDHVLFVLGLFLLSGRARQVLLQITAFTVAHSITLALSMYGLATVPSSIVEPAIALSIAYIALENVFRANLTRWRYALVFAFGLLHGLGFAGALSQVGLPRREFLTALLSFNVGVELGQLTVITAAFVSVGYWFSDRAWYRQRIVLPASACIACVGIYWTLERLHYVA